VTFLVDGMLGRLARWLRILGYDAEYHPGLEDRELARIARAEDRILLTRDTELARRKGFRSLLVESQELEEQLRQVVAELGLRPWRRPARCTLCNAPLEEATPDEVRDLVPPYVGRTQTRFTRCPACRRVYWPGTHWRRMVETLQSLHPGEEPTHS
jgi:uncharacterized protein with PIN domain